MHRVDRTSSSFHYLTEFFTNKYEFVTCVTDWTQKQKKKGENTISVEIFTTSSQRRREYIELLEQLEQLLAGEERTPYTRSGASGPSAS